MAFIRTFWLDKYRGKYLTFVEMPNGDEILMVQISMEELDTLRPMKNGDEK